MSEQLIWLSNTSTEPENVFHNVSAYAGNSVSGVMDTEQVVTWDFHFVHTSTNAPYAEGIVVDSARYFWQEESTYKIVMTITDPPEAITERFTIFSWRGEQFDAFNFFDGLFFLEHESGGDLYFLIPMDESTPPAPAFINIVPGSTNEFQMKLHLSSDNTLGWLEILLNGGQVIFEDGSSRIYLKTYDGLKTNPVWSYGSVTGEDTNLYMKDLKVYLVTE
ncbi:hypothetical protein [Kluyvera intermedia]|uniref:hypothetical protein n=1 Tax=Kluyvera intermedia TaxID=61648 RepID=UPI00352444CC